MQELDLNTVSLLRKESFLASMNLWVWLTFMWKYDFLQLWFFYQSMFSLSIGIERLMKLILVYEELTSPYEIDLKKYWHNLDKLYKKTEELWLNYGVSDYFKK